MCCATQKGLLAVWKRPIEKCGTGGADAVRRYLDDVRIADLLITELADENLIESKVTKR